jgi:hypothetical protein
MQKYVLGVDWKPWERKEDKEDEKEDNGKEETDN